MIRSRPRPKVKAGPAPLSDDRFDKFIAAMCWYVGRSKDDPEYVTSAFYYSAVWEWFDRLSLDDAERVHTVVYVYSTPGYGGEKAAVTYAALLPSAPTPPQAIRKAWGHGLRTLTPSRRRGRRLTVLAALAVNGALTLSKAY